MKFQLEFNLLENPFYVLAMLCLMVIVAYYLSKTAIGKKFGIALIVIVITAIIANLDLVPTASNSIPLYDAIFTYLAPISIFYLLLNVNLKSLLRAGTPMIVLFLLGSLATTVGVLTAWFVLSPQNVLGSDGAVLAGMLTGTYTGGSVNFNAVALAYDFQEKGALYAGTVAVDNVVTTIWIVLTLAIPAFLRKFWKDKKIDSNTKETTLVEENSLDPQSFLWLIFLGVSAYLVADLITGIFPEVPTILSITTLGIILAQTKFVANLKGSHTLGLYLVYIFLAVIGAYCEIDAVFKLKELGIVLFAFTSMAVLFHGVITILLGGLFYRDWEMVSIASQANIGGGTTAIALAETFERKELVLPAILVGTLGNALGTYLGFLVVGIL